MVLKQDTLLKHMRQEQAKASDSIGETIEEAEVRDTWKDDKVEK